MTKAEELQRSYYEESAASYDDLHVSPEDEHSRALKHISALLDLVGITSILDVGCGTGRGIKFFLVSRPGIRVHGIEPVQALIKQGIERNGIPMDLITCGRGECLPFPDQSFDAVLELGVLHHVERPDLIVKEMMRVARKAVFLSDGNRFACGSIFSRLAKLSLYKLRLFRPAYLLKTLGRGYRFSEGDGVAYSFSVYDVFHILAKWATRIFAIPLGKEKPFTWLHPLISSLHVLLCAIREDF
jgi:ubiquinone/menaquinone biosynthesis C-methylase UbiE